MATTNPAISRLHVTVPWVRSLFLGAIICGVIGPVIGVTILGTFHAIQESSVRAALTALTVLPWAWIAAIIFMGPAGFVLGALGASWIRFRARSLHVSKRLWLESTLLGTALGACVPVSGMVWGWRLRETVLPEVPLGAASGLICALLVVGALIRRGLLISANSASSN
jgi:hypothetical protein